MGLLVGCSRRCDRGTESKKEGKSVRLTCNGCFDSWWVPAYRTEDSTSLGHGLVAVPYPQEFYPWKNTQGEAKPTPVPGQTRGKFSKRKYTRGGLSKHSSTNALKTPAIKLHPTSPTDTTPHLPLLEAVTRSNSLPIASSSTNPFSTPHSIRPPSYATSTLEPSTSEGTHSATATPPPPSPQEPPTSQGMAPNHTLRAGQQGPTRKRASNSALRSGPTKKPKSEGGESDGGSD